MLENLHGNNDLRNLISKNDPKSVGDYDSGPNLLTFQLSNDRELKTIKYAYAIVWAFSIGLGVHMGINDSESGMGGMGVEEGGEGFEKLQG